jgi:hypothetical protein
MLPNAQYIISSKEPGYLHGSIQFDRSRRLGGIIIPRAATAASLFFVRGAILWKDLPLSEGELRGVGRKRVVRSWSRQQTTYLSDPVEVIYG